MKADGVDYCCWHEKSNLLKGEGTCDDVPDYPLCPSGREKETQTRT
jgi:hypothetical protein